MLTEGEGVNYQLPNYHPLTIPLASVSQISTAPLVIEFPLQYLGFVRWKSFADTGGRRRRQAP